MRHVRSVGAMMLACTDIAPTMPWPFLHHPAFQSLLLPALLGGLCTLALHRALGGQNRSWGAFGPSLGLVLAMLWWPGFAWPAAAQAQKLPWIVLLGLFAAVAAQVFAVSRVAPAGRAAAGALRGALALLVLLALLAGLAVFAVVSGSLLLAQLALMVAASAGVTLLWAWVQRESGPRITAVSLLPLLADFLALLALVAALGWPSSGSQPSPGGAADDPYYTPRW